MAFTIDAEATELDLQEYLTPGSVWHRTKKKKVYSSTVICVTNEHVSESHSEEYPKMVIYLDSKDRFCSLPVEDFIAKRTFYNVNPSIESSVENLTSQENTNEEGDEVVIESEQITGTLENSENQENEESEYDPRKIFKFFTSTPDSRNDDFLLEVQDNIETYTQRPDYVNDVINHEIYLRSGFDTKRLITLLTENSNGVREIDSFAIEGVVYRISAMLGIFPMYAADGKYNILYLASVMKLDSDDDEEETIVSETSESSPLDDTSSDNSNNPPQSDLVSKLQANIVKN